MKALFILFFITALYAKNIDIMTSLPLSGLNAQTGNLIANGAKLYFEHANKTAKNRLNLIAFDDSYLPEVSAQNYEKLSSFEYNMVFMPFGVSNIRALTPKILNSQTIAFAPHCDSNFIYQDTFKNIVNTRPSLGVEMELGVSYFIKNGDKKFGIFYQNDEFGEEIYNALAKALSTHGLMISSSASTRRNTLNVSLQARTISPDLDTVFMGCACISAANFINEYQKINPKAKFLLPAAMNRNLMLEQINEKSNLYFASFAPSFDDGSELSKLYLKLCKDNSLTPDELSYEAFLNAFLFEEAMMLSNFAKDQIFTEVARKVIDKRKIFNTFSIKKLQDNSLKQIFEKKIDAIR